MAKQDTAVKAVKKSDKKAEKATTKVVKSTYGSAELRDKELKVLLEDMKSVRSDLADARCSLAAGELVNPNVIPQYRKTIARIQTVIVEKARAVHGKEDA